MKKIVFFNYAHKGDVFFSRAFVSHIIEEINVDFLYAHYWGDYLLRDLNLKYIHLDQIVKNQSNNERASNYVVGDTVYINTWIGKYFDHSKPMYGECSLRSLYYLMYSEIFEFLSKIFSINLNLKEDICEYFPDINYSFFDTSFVDTFLQSNKNKKILFCNGPALSGQCDSYNGDMGQTIRKFSEKYKNITFIVTHKLNYKFDNILYTGDIIQSNIEVLNDGQVSVNKQDLNEISYLSKFCDIIIGKSSGPFSFTNTKENMFDEKKVFLCFGKKENDCGPYQLNINCEYVYEKFSTVESLEETINEMIENEVKN